VRPLGVGGVLHLLPLQGVLTAVKAYVFAILGNAWNRLKFLRYRNVDRRLTQGSSRPGDDMTDLAHDLVSLLK
jgi:hypothetical protein